MNVNFPMFDCQLVKENLENTSLKILNGLKCEHLTRFRGEVCVQRRGGRRRHPGAEAPEGGVQIELERGAQEPGDDDGLRIHRHAAPPALIAKLQRERRA